MIPRLFHIRMVTILSILWLVDIVLVAVAADSILTEGPSVMIMFASEYMILLATLVGTSLKYGANAYDLRGEVPWENKSVFIFYVELACDFLKLATYLCFFSLILTFYGLPLNILRDVYITARSFINKIRDLSRYRQATRNMDQRYPNATAEEMERLSDKTCIICREDMEARSEAQNQARDSRSGPNDTPKKLPCGHIFHFHCLRSWLERQQSCPTWLAAALDRVIRSTESCSPLQPTPRLACSQLRFNRAAASCTTPTCSRPSSWGAASQTATSRSAAISSANRAALDTASSNEWASCSTFFLSTSSRVTNTFVPAACRPRKPTCSLSTSVCSEASPGPQQLDLEQRKQRRSRCCTRFCAWVKYRSSRKN